MAPPPYQVDLQTSISYFSSGQKSKLKNMYTTSFPDEDIPGAVVSNHKWEIQDVLVKDFRTYLSPQLDVHGFAFLKMRTILPPDDLIPLSRSRRLTTLNWQVLMQKSFPRYKSFAFFDHQVGRLRMSSNMVFIMLTSTARGANGFGMGESSLCRSIKHDFRHHLLSKVPLWN
jgi:hypothetical protein